jgi:monoamine oxidase
MSPSADQILDVAIVGGGISGLYTGWRLLTGTLEPNHQPPGKRVAIFELGGRTGGRLLTWRPFIDEFELHAELGGMRFFEQQRLVWSLISYFVKERKLAPPIKFYVADPNGNNLWYLRERILKSNELTNPDQLPYLLDAASRYADPASVVNRVIEDILMLNRPAIAEKLDGRMRPETWEDWDKVKPYLCYRHRRLWDIGFWNLLFDLLSPETYAYVTDAFGYFSVTNNWNAAEAMQSLYIDFTQNPDYHTLREGYDYLPYLVRQAFLAANGEIRLHTPVVAIDRDREGLFEVWLREAEKPLRARSVVLAMPRRSLELLHENAFWNLDRVIDPKENRSLRDCIRAVIPFPAFKLFLAYGTRWWQASPFHIAAGRSVSDLPIRQTYYFPPAPSFSPDALPAKGRGLVMASYDDLGAVPFWQALEAPMKEREREKRILSEMAKRVALDAADSDLTSHVKQTLHALAEEPGFNYAPPEMVRHAQEQLELLHFNRSLPSPMNRPGSSQGEFLAAYMDWGRDPYGGGWNFWAPLIDVRETMQAMRRPFEDIPLYIVGEAYSGAQGWVEGALTIAERVLRDHFGLGQAAWQPEGYYMGY